MAKITSKEERRVILIPKTPSPIKEKSITKRLSPNEMTRASQEEIVLNFLWQTAKKSPPPGTKSRRTTQNKNLIKSKNSSIKIG